MPKILGLDLGSNSIGWAFITQEKNQFRINRLGVRVIPFQGDEKDEFSKGQAISLNKARTLKRTARKTLFRYKLRRERLVTELSGLGMLPTPDLVHQPTALALYALRAKAIHEKISLQELGRVLLHLNQKRGYKGSRKDSSDQDKNLSEYLDGIKERKEMLESRDISIGEYLYEQLQRDSAFRTKKLVFPRESYLFEFNKIWDRQAKEYPKILTEEFKTRIRDEIIFFQRRLKSQKHLVGHCQFEKHHRVAPKSSPLFQVEKIWESINNLSLVNKRKEYFNISPEKKKEIFAFLNDREKMTQTDLLKILGLKRTDGWRPNEQIAKAGIQGNLTRAKFIQVFQALDIPYDQFLKFELKVLPITRIDKGTGEVIESSIISSDFEYEPLYKLWHLIYSIDDPANLIDVLVKQYGFSQDKAAALSNLDFKTSGFGNKSSRAIRKLLPALIDGHVYSEAAKLCGYNHSNSLSTEENASRVLKDVLVQYRRNSLRQPVVEKVMNQLVNLVNGILREEGLGRPDEIHIELARELRQSREERKRDYDHTLSMDRLHKTIRMRLENEFPGVKVTRKVIEKYKLFTEQNGICIYSGRKMELAQALFGEGIDIDHIIPQSRLFDDSYQNKALAFRSENEAKGDLTAWDYMGMKSADELNAYLERIRILLEDKNISRSKYEKLKMAVGDIPDDFISRQLNETRFISREAARLLKEVCRNVYLTSGRVTDFLRNQWGYNEVLQQLNFGKYEAAGSVENGKIRGWSKRDDHRHHAIDALVVAATQQSFIQRLNTLNAESTRTAMKESIPESAPLGWQKRKSLLEQHVQGLQPFTTQEVMGAISQILVSQKPGKRVGSFRTNPANGQRCLTPRGQLHKEQVYGKIRRYRKDKVALNGNFKNWDLIANPIEKKKVEERLKRFGGDAKQAFKNLNDDPIWIDELRNRKLTEVTLWEEFFVYKYTLDVNFKEKDIESIIDDGIRQKVRLRFDERKGQKDHPLKNLENDPIWLNEAKRIPVKCVRCFTGLKELVPLHITKHGLTIPKYKGVEGGEPVDYISTRNNHHIGIYKNEKGEYKEYVVSFWEALERKRHGLPPIISDPAIAWNIVLKKGLDNQELLAGLPNEKDQFLISLQQNEMFLFGLDNEAINEAMEQNDMALLSSNLYRVQKIAISDYFFRHHLETKLEAPSELSKSIGLKKVIRFNSVKSFMKRIPIKVSIDSLGKIQKV